MGISILARQGIFWGMLVVLLAGCASLGASREEALRRRVTAFWDAKLAGDVVAQYDYEDVSKTNEVTLQNYAGSGGGIRYLSYQIEAIRLKGPREAEVRMIVEYVVPPVITKPVKTEFVERWIKIDNQWYHVKRKRRLL